MANQLLIESQIAPEPIGNLALLINANQFLTHQLWEQGRYMDARDVALKGVELAPGNPAMQFNAGTLLLANPVKETDPLLWRRYLNEFIVLTDNDPQSTPSSYVKIARTVIQTKKLDISSFTPLRPANRPPKLDPLDLYY